MYGFVGSVSGFKAGDMQRSRCTRARRHVVAAAAVQKVSGSELEKELQDTSIPLVVDFYATWCGPCQFMVPELEFVAKEYGDRIRVLKVDSEEEPDVSTLLQVRALPTLFFIYKNQLRYRMEGAVMRSDLKMIIEKVFFTDPEELQRQLREKQSQQ